MPDDDPRGPRAHPRRCGEHPYDVCSKNTSRGSSPQVRGTSDHCEPHRAHPRRCGQHSNSMTVCGVGMGSSPQVRGTFGAANGEVESSGLIPAGAGNMVLAPRPTTAARAHPRRCGEHVLLPVGYWAVRGSSPQVRGTSVVVGSDGVASGLIPAGAGNITSVPLSVVRRAAHPRRCGEHPPGLARILMTRGSSPQVRGTSVSGGGVVERFRLIPAGAGNIPCSSDEVRSARGSSPQVRGTFQAVQGR